MNRARAIRVSVELVIVIIVDIIVDHIVRGSVLVSETTIGIAAAAVVIRAVSIRAGRGVRRRVGLLEGRLLLLLLLKKIRWLVEQLRARRWRWRRRNDVMQRRLLLLLLTGSCQMMICRIGRDGIL